MIANNSNWLRIIDAPDPVFVEIGRFRLWCEVLKQRKRKEEKFGTHCLLCESPRTQVGQTTLKGRPAISTNAQPLHGVTSPRI